MGPDFDFVTYGHIFISHNIALKNRTCTIYIDYLTFLPISSGSFVLSPLYIKMVLFGIHT